MKQLVDGIIQRVKGIVSPILLNEGMELVDIEYRRESRGWVLRLFIDKEGGITLENCAHISEELGRTLDVEDFIPNPYILEVSSPGLDRPLKKEKDFIKYLQHRIKVKTFDPIEQRRNFRGKLLRVTEGRIELDLEDRIIQIPLSNVAKANLEIDF